MTQKYKYVNEYKEINTYIIKNMPSNSTEYMRNYRRKMYAEQPEKCRSMRSKKYARERYGFTSEEMKTFEDHSVLHTENSHTFLVMVKTL